MAKKNNVKAQIKLGKDALKQIMQQNLADLADSIISTVCGRLKRLTPAQRLDAIKDVPTPGAVAYKSLLQTALSVISYDAIQAARKEVPKAKSIRLAESDDGMQLGEFENLPPEIQRKIIAESQLLVGTQIADLEKAIYFQFTSSHDSTDSIETVKQDLEDAADDYVRGSGIEAGAGVLSAKYINTARSAFFYDDKVLDEIDAFEFVNGDPVTDICADLAGTIFAKDDANADRYQPPLHWNCKSFIRPILKGNLPATDEIEDLKPSTKKLEDSIQFSETTKGGCPTCGLA
jgi:hypothetical protein